MPVPCLQVSVRLNTIFETEVTSWELTKADLVTLTGTRILRPWLKKGSLETTKTLETTKYVRVALSKSFDTGCYYLQLASAGSDCTVGGNGLIKMYITEDDHSIVEMVNMSGAKIIIFTKMERPFHIPSIRIIIFKPETSKFAIELFQTISSHCPMVSCKKNVGKVRFVASFFRNNFRIKRIRIKLGSRLFEVLKIRLFQLWRRF